MFESISRKHHAVPHRGIVPLLIATSTATACCPEGGHASEAEAEAEAGSDERRTPSTGGTARGDGA